MTNFCKNFWKKWIAKGFASEVHDFNIGNFRIFFQMGSSVPHQVLTGYLQIKGGLPTKMDNTVNAII